MTNPKLRARVGFDERELGSRRAYFDIGDGELALLASLRPLAEEVTDEIVEGFYRHILGHPESRRFFPDDATVRRVKALQARYFRGLFEGRCDDAYVEERLRVGAVHERIGLAPKWYLGSYRLYLELLRERLTAKIGDPAAAEAAYRAAVRIVFFDMSLAIDMYIATNLEAIQRHQAAIRELSTPVIRVHDGVLLLPIVGTVDSRRAQQIMETVLTRVADDQARAMILDIAGVAVVDTEVADHLLKTTAAVRLLGAETILTGISAEVARTIVQLGVDISTMHTRNRLADGIELALRMIGKKIQAVT
jgi:rsbT co-antagonist protein RsbR